jgi:ADP-ribose pyrophosphatase YjhB (NUDIX family)
MIQFDTPEGKFVYRAASVTRRGEQVLLHQFEGQEFWCLPGGRMEMNEPARDCVRREMLEEMDLAEDVDVRAGDLLFIIENLYTYQGARHHEIGLYFEASLPPDSAQMHADTFIGHEWDNSELYFQWFSPSELGTLDLRPAVLKTLLQQPPTGHPQYILHREEHLPA